MGTVTSIIRTRFAIGQLVHHRMFDYRGVIVDVHPRFQASESWYESVARSRPPRDKPWYHVLVDEATHTTYVAERNLEPAATDEPIEHPLLGLFFNGFESGRYISSRPRN